MNLKLPLVSCDWNEIVPKGRQNFLIAIQKDGRWFIRISDFMPHEFLKDIKKHAGIRRLVLATRFSFWTVADALIWKSCTKEVYGGIDFLSPGYSSSCMALQWLSPLSSSGIRQLPCLGRFQCSSCVPLPHAAHISFSDCCMRISKTTNNTSRCMTFRKQSKLAP
ncbi:hypothetical protein TNIN_93561 [Trichonephila inaurata madagascariensis]|uniref:Uncharacterized protein n=1 Tax=Trichonephila inaurata madagascariensis TaxID=2747483 RepID=A0A8X6WWB6_9ARAC|nr:hypothetical protein TNIN_93561 [Trichonephila inaurata madagascariensis]